MIVINEEVQILPIIPKSLPIKTTYVKYRTCIKLPIKVNVGDVFHT